MKWIVLLLLAMFLFPFKTEAGCSCACDDGTGFYSTNDPRTPMGGYSFNDFNYGPNETPPQERSSDDPEVITIEGNKEEPLEVNICDIDDSGEYFCQSL